jgi:hypothetical protein
MEDLKNWRGVQQWQADKAIDQGFDEARQGGEFAFSDPVGAREAYDFWGGVGPGDVGNGAAVAGIMAGKKSMMADLKALARAQYMNDGGAPREQIWNETGWWQGPDQQWRYEIPDSASEYLRARPDVLHPKEDGIWSREAVKSVAERARDKAPDVGYWDSSLDRANLESSVYKNAPLEVALQHYGFEGAYPDLRLMIKENPSLRSKAAYGEGDGFGLIQLQDSGWNSERPNEDIRLSILHELQHALQGVEGFADGGSAADLAAEFGVSQKEGRDLYKRLAGETEARLVEQRANLTRQELKSRPPWTMFDVPEDQQIVRRR